MELEVGADRESLPWTTALRERSLPRTFSQGRVQHPGQLLALWPSQELAQAPTLHHLKFDLTHTAMLPLILIFKEYWSG